MKKLSFFLVLIVIAASCSIVELDNEASSGVGAPVETEAPDEADIDLGSQTIPADSATAAEYFHGVESKTWEADEFIIDGAGFTTELSCRLDDTITLNVDGSFDYDSGQWSCGGEEGTAQDRIGNFEITSMDQTNFLISFTNVDGFEDATFEGKVWTLEEDVLVLSATYESSIFGTFTVTGRYTAQ